ncbi:MAG: transposase family protein [Oscillospiraceae bacterium]|jgi:hypothetical protein|nr:transposase family protein [Oscillospiraceae bacterium]
MDNEKRIAKLAEEKYPVLFGVEKRTFDVAKEALDIAYAEMRKKGGFPRKLSVLDMLIVFFAYVHDNRTMENIGFDYGVSKQRISEAVFWVEKNLLACGKFSLPGKKELLNVQEHRVLLLDATDCRTERPKKNKFERNITPENTNVIP